MDIDVFTAAWTRFDVGASPSGAIDRPKRAYDVTFVPQTTQTSTQHQQQTKSFNADVLVIVADPDLSWLYSRLLVPTSKDGVALSKNLDMTTLGYFTEKRLSTALAQRFKPNPQLHQHHQSNTSELVQQQQQQHQHLSRSLARLTESDLAGVSSTHLPLQSPDDVPLATLHSISSSSTQSARVILFSIHASPYLPHGPPPQIYPALATALRQTVTPSFVSIYTLTPAATYVAQGITPLSPTSSGALSPTPTTSTSPSPQMTDSSDDVTPQTKDDQRTPGNPNSPSVVAVLNNQSMRYLRRKNASSIHLIPTFSSSSSSLLSSSTSSPAYPRHLIPPTSFSLPNCLFDFSSAALEAFSIPSSPSSSLSSSSSSSSSTSSSSTATYIPCSIYVVVDDRYSLGGETLATALLLPFYTSHDALIVSSTAITSSTNTTNTTSSSSTSLTEPSNNTNAASLLCVLAEALSRGAVQVFTSSSTSSSSSSASPTSPTSPSPTSPSSSSSSSSSSIDALFTRRVISALHRYRDDRATRYSEALRALRMVNKRSHRRPTADADVTGVGSASSSMGDQGKGDRAGEEDYESDDDVDVLDPLGRPPADRKPIPSTLYV